jgi:hypothetical protein
MNDQDLIDSLSARSPLEQINRAQIASDIFKVLTGVGIVLVTGLGLVFAFAWLMFGAG